MHFGLSLHALIVLLLCHDKTWTFEFQIGKKPWYTVYHLHLHKYDGPVRAWPSWCWWLLRSNQQNQKSVTRIIKGNQSCKSSQTPLGRGEEVNASIEPCAKPCIFERLVSMMVNATFTRPAKPKECYWLAKQRNYTCEHMLILCISCRLVHSSCLYRTIFIFTFSGSLSLSYTQGLFLSSVAAIGFHAGFLQLLSESNNHIYKSYCHLLAVQSSRLPAYGWKHSWGFASIQQNCFVCWNMSVLYIYS